MAELKTHLLYETLDMAFKKKIKITTRHQLHLDEPKFWKFDKPQDTCALAISSSHGYRMVAYIVKYVATCVSGFFEFQCGVVISPNIFAPILSFSPKNLIRRLMFLAGRYCTSIENYLYYYEGVDRFMHGLAFNDALSATDIADDEFLFYCYMEGRSFVKSLQCDLTEFYGGFHCLQHIGNAVIGSLVIDGFFKSTAGACKLLRGLKIEKLHILPGVCPAKLSRDIFYGTTPQLKYMKRFHCGNKIDISLTIKMLKRYHIDDIRFDDVRFVNVVQSVKKAMDALWTAIENNKGARIVVNCSQTNRFPNLQPTAVIAYLHEHLPDFVIDFNEHIEWKYTKTVGLKSMKVVLAFSWA